MNFLTSQLENKITLSSIFLVCDAEMQKRKRPSVSLVAGNPAITEATPRSSSLRDVEYYTYDVQYY